MGGNAKRLGSPDIPKPLTEISDGKTVLDYALEPLLSYYKNITLVPILPFESAGVNMEINERRRKWGIKLSLYMMAKYHEYPQMRYFQAKTNGVIDALAIACENLYYHPKLQIEPCIVLLPDTIQLNFPKFFPDGNWITVADRTTSEGGLVEVSEFPPMEIINISDESKYPFCEGQLTPSGIYHFRSLTLLSRGVSHVSESGYTNMSDLIRYFILADITVSAIHVGQMIDIGTPEELIRVRKYFNKEN
jgi:choline kinase